MSRDLCIILWSYVRRALIFCLLLYPWGCFPTSPLLPLGRVHWTGAAALRPRSSGALSLSLSLLNGPRLLAVRSIRPLCRLLKKSVPSAAEKPSLWLRNGMRRNSGQESAPCRKRAPCNLCKNPDVRSTLLPLGSADGSKTGCFLRYCFPLMHDKALLLSSPHLGMFSRPSRN